MSKAKTILRMKGLNTPRLFIWLRGFLHGKIIHTGGLDPETNIISSSYITGQTRRFRNACVTRRERAEAKLAKVWGEADRLLIDFASISSALSGSGRNQSHHCENNAQARANERDASRRASLEAERRSILKRLVTIVNEIRTEYISAHDQMEATAEIILSKFACYGHGMLMKPVNVNNLPAMVYEDCAKRILTSHEDIWNIAASVLKEAK